MSEQKEVKKQREEQQDNVNKGQQQQQTTSTNHTGTILGAAALVLALVALIFVLWPGAEEPQQAVPQEDPNMSGDMETDGAEGRDAPDDIEVEEEVSGGRDLYVTGFADGWDERGKMVDSGTKINNGPALVDLGQGRAMYVGENESYTLDSPHLIWLYESTDQKMEGEFLFFNEVVDQDGNALYQR